MSKHNDDGVGKHLTTLSPNIVVTNNNTVSPTTHDGEFFRSKVTKEEVYRTYDPWVGIRTAGFLGGMLLLLIVYIVVKAGRHKRKEARRSSCDPTKLEYCDNYVVNAAPTYQYPHELPTVIVDSVEATAFWVEDQPSEVSSISTIGEDSEETHDVVQRRASDGNISSSRRASIPGILKPPTRSKTLKEGSNLLKRYQVNFPDTKDTTMQVQVQVTDTDNITSYPKWPDEKRRRIAKQAERPENNMNEVPRIRRPSFRSLRDILSGVRIKNPNTHASVESVNVKQRLLDNISLCNSAESTPKGPPRKARTLSFSLASTDRLNLPDASIWSRKKSSSSIDDDNHSIDSHSSNSTTRASRTSSVFLHPEDANLLRQHLERHTMPSICTGPCLQQQHRHFPSVCTGTCLLKLSNDLPGKLYASTSHGNIPNCDKVTQKVKFKHGRKYSLL